jgi:hypothetical protein
VKYITKKLLAKDKDFHAKKSESINNKNIRALLKFCFSFEIKNYRRKLENVR